MHTGLESQTIYDTQTNHFDSVVVLKPANSGTSIEHTFAPLILQVVKSSGSTPTQRRISWMADTITINGSIYARISYGWLAGDAALRGIRLTLDSNGFPTLWESLGDTEDERMVFVSRSLETAAASRHGPPLHGRRYSIEPAVTGHNDVIVPRVLDDAATPMGPIIYVSEDWNEILTIICRCMPSQAKSVRAMETYDLAPSSAGLPSPASGAERLRLP